MRLQCQCLALLGEMAVVVARRLGVYRKGGTRNGQGDNGQIESHALVTSDAVRPFQVLALFFLSYIGHWPAS